MTPISICSKPHSRASVGLEIGFAKLRVDIEGVVRPACLYRVPSLFQSSLTLDRAGGERDKYTVSLGKTEGDAIRKLFMSIAAHDSSILDINPFIELLLELGDLPRFSPLQALGYFVILESVLTHFSHGLLHNRRYT